jgi:hypothetical protein
MTHRAKCKEDRYLLSACPVKPFCICLSGANLTGVLCPLVYEVLKQKLLKSQVIKLLTY